MISEAPRALQRLRLPVAIATCSAPSLLGGALGWRGGDLPAQVFRAAMFRKVGFTLWDNRWYSGHPTLGYSMIMPFVAARINPVFLNALAGALAAIAFWCVARRAWPHTVVPWVWFAIGMASNVALGRITFGIGFAFALAAVAAMQRELVALAAMGALAAACTSPVAGLFIALAAAVWALSQREHRIGAVVIGGIALVPSACVALFFESEGPFPYSATAAARDITCCAVIFAVTPRTNRIVRIGSALYAALCAAAFVVDSPLGSNVSRLGQYSAGPIVAGVLWPHRKRLLFALALPVVVWPWLPAIEPVLHGSADPAAHAPYYAPLLTALDALRPFGRVEVVPLFHHWEAVYVAERFAIARGWERQLDIRDNPQFYSGQLDTAKYHAWLLDNAVQYVAIADARIDVGGTREHELLQHPPSFLTNPQRVGHWHLWKVNDFKGFIDGSAEFVHLGVDNFTLRFTEPGSAIVRVRYTARWNASSGACVSESRNHWTQITASRAGTYTVKPQLFPHRC